MSGPKTPPPSGAAKPAEQRKSSGEYQLEIRKRLESFDENTLPKLEAAAQRLENALSITPNPIPSPPTEGEWTITIHGNGLHHNSDARDANRFAVRFVAELRAAGQTVMSARFDNGAGEDILPISTKVPPP